MNKAQLIFLIALLVFSSSCLANKQLKVFFDKESGIQISANCYGVTIKEGVREDSLNFVMFRDFTQRYLCHRCCNEQGNRILLPKNKLCSEFIGPASHFEFASHAGFLGV